MTISGNMAAKTQDEDPVMIVRTRKPVSANDLRTNRKVPSYKKDFSYNEIKVGGQTIFEATYHFSWASTNQLHHGEAFAVLEDNVVLFGPTGEALRKILVRGKAAELSAELQRAVKDTDFTKTMAWAIDLKALVGNEKFTSDFNRDVGPLFGEASKSEFLKKLESFFFEGSLKGSDAIVRAWLTTRDAETAADVRKRVEVAKIILRGMLQGLPRVPKDVLVAINAIKVTVEGAKVNATGQVKAETVVEWIEDECNPESHIHDYQEKQERSTNQAATDQNELGLTLTGCGKVDEAIVHYRKALEIDPDFTAAHSNLGLALAGRGQVDEAIAHYRKALEINPGYGKAHNNLGNALAGRGQVDEAMAHYRKALEIKPDFELAHSNLGLALAGRGQVDEAIAHFRKAPEIRPNYVEAHYNLGLVLAGRGRHDEALEHYQKALGLATARNNRPLADVIRARIRLEKKKLQPELDNRGPK